MLYLALLIFQSITINAAEPNLPDALSFVKIPHHGPVHPRYKNTLFLLDNKRMRAITFSSVSIPRAHSDDYRTWWFFPGLLAPYVSFKYLLPLAAIWGFFIGFAEQVYYGYRYNRIEKAMDQLPPQLTPSNVSRHIIPLENLQCSRPEGKALYDLLTNDIPWIKDHMKNVPHPMIKIEEISLEKLIRAHPQGSLMGFEKIELTTVQRTDNNIQGLSNSRLVCCQDTFERHRQLIRTSYKEILLKLLVAFNLKRASISNVEALNDRFTKVANALMLPGREHLVTQFRMP